MLCVFSDLADSFSFFVDRGVGIINASPVAMGLLGTLPIEGHPAVPMTRRACEQAAKYCTEKGFSLRELLYRARLKGGHQVW